MFKYVTRLDKNEDKNEFNNSDFFIQEKKIISALDLWY